MNLLLTPSLALGKKRKTSSTEHKNSATFDDSTVFALRKRFLSRF